jgi:ferrochelatase
VDEALASMQWDPRQRRISDYHLDEAWVGAIADSIMEFRNGKGAAGKLVFSLHGVPERYVEEGDPYRDQCEASVQAIVERLGLAGDEWLLAYQSRVGREPWLQPYTDISLQEMAAAGVGSVQVVCPGFAVDCLETLEEIAMQNRELFESAGGEKLEYIPALNDSKAHVEVMRRLIESSVGEIHE